MNALHPTLKSLWNIPHVLRFPDTMPAVPELIQFIEKHIAEWRAERQNLNPTLPGEAERIAIHNCNIAVLENKLDELRRAFPEFGMRDEVPLSLSAPTASPNQNHNPSPTAANNSPSPSVGEGRGEGAATLAVHTSPITPSLTTKKNPEITETSETDLQPQPHRAETEVRPTETQVRLTETELRLTETEPIPTGPVSPPPCPSPITHVSEPNTSTEALTDKSFQAALAKIPEKQRQIAADLYEHVHYRARFAALTSQQRAGLYEVCRQYTVDEVLELLPQPPPIGLNLHTSRAGLFRFFKDFKSILLDEKKLAAHEQNEEQRLASEQAFQNANASDETFRQATERRIRKRLFTTVENPKGDHHEIRWLLKSLEMIRKPAVSHEP